MLSFYTLNFNDWMKKFGLNEKFNEDTVVFSFVKQKLENLPTLLLPHRIYCRCCYCVRGNFMVGSCNICKKSFHWRYWEFQKPRQGISHFKKFCWSFNGSFFDGKGQYQMCCFKYLFHGWSEYNKFW